MDVKKILFSMTLCGVVSNVNAFENGDILSFEPGVVTCVIDGVYPNCLYGISEVTSGSYFALDANGDGRFTEWEKIPLSPGPDGGIIIGQLQPGFSDCYNSNATAGIDEPWSFFGCFGIHQTTVYPVIDNGDGTLDFRGWGVSWNSIPNINLGGDPALGDTGMATVSCANSPCQQGDDFTLDYIAHVPLGDPSGFGGVRYGLHLDGFPAEPRATISISVEGGRAQECSETGGSTLVMNASTTVPDGDSVESIGWTVDGNPLPDGASIDGYIALGSHIITANVQTVGGLTASATTSVTIRDTTPPEISAGFLDRMRGLPTEEIQRFNFLQIQAAATDVCDPSPEVEAMIGGAVQDGTLVYIMKYFGNVSINLSAIDLTVHAKDASNNSSSATTTLNIQ